MFIVKILCFIYGKTCYIHMRSLCVCIAKQQQQQHNKPFEKTKKAYLYFTEVGTLEQTRLWVP